MDGGKNGEEGLRFQNYPHTSHVDRASITVNNSPVQYTHPDDHDYCRLHLSVYT